MQLTDEIARRYKGGQIEVQNRGEGYFYRGEIASIMVVDAGEDPTLVVTLVWMAKGEGPNILPDRWVNHENLSYAAGLVAYAVSDIGDDRLCLESPFFGELTILFPPGGSRLDPAKVEGLVLTSLAR